MTEPSTGDTSATTSQSQEIEHAIVQLKAVRAELVGQISKCFSAISTLARTRTQDGERDKLKKDLANLREQISEVDEDIQEAQDAIAQYTAATPPHPPTPPAIDDAAVSASDVSSQVPTPSRPSASTPTHLFVPKVLPKFRDGSDSIHNTEEFLAAFEKMLKVHAISIDEHWNRLLLACLNTTNAAWMETFIPCDADWKTARCQESGAERT
jgi:hypothetical protein